MDTQHSEQVLESLAQNLAGDTSVKKVYGEPIVTQGKTIIPVPKVSLGFGGGFGKSKKRAQFLENAPDVSQNDESSGKNGGEGMGMGGGMMARPIGVIEVTPERTRFIPLNIARYVVLGAALGIVLGRFWRRRR